MYIFVYVCLEFFDVTFALPQALPVLWYIRIFTSEIFFFKVRILKGIANNIAQIEEITLI